MTDILFGDLLLGISGIPEPNYNSRVPGYSATGVAPAPANVNNYLGMLTTGRGFPLPDKEKHTDAGKIGRRRPFMRYQRSGYVLPPTMEIAEEVSADLFAMFLRRCFGGADPTPAGGAILEPGAAFEHKFGFLDTAGAAGRQLPASSVVYALGGADYVYCGVVFDTIRVDQTNANPPTFTAGMVGSGLHYRLRDLSAAPAVVAGKNEIQRPDPAAPVDQPYMHGAETYMEFTDVNPATGLARTISLTATNQRLRAFTCTISNNHNTGDRRPGDKRIDATTTTKGWYVNRMLHNRTAEPVTAEMTIMLDDSMIEFDDANSDTEITSYKYRMQGDYIEDATGAFTDHQYTVELEYPKCYYRGVRGTDDNGDAVLTVGIAPAENPSVLYGPVRARVINKRATSIV